MHCVVKILLLTPPMTQVNSPYPATPYLTGFLRKEGYEVCQDDPAIELLLRLLSPLGLKRIATIVRTLKAPTKSVKHFLKHEGRYLEIIPSLIRYLQGGDPTLAYRIVADNFVPRGPRFTSMADVEASIEGGIEAAFGPLGIHDQAKYIASLCIDDLADVIRDGVDPRFGLARYAEKLAASAPSFDPIRKALEAAPTFVDETLDQITAELIERVKPRVVGITVPFPGNVYGAFRIARQIKKINPHIKVVLGGGYVNTELRELSDPRVFDYVDFITLDDGHEPLLRILESQRAKHLSLSRTFVRENGTVVLKNDPKSNRNRFSDVAMPTYVGLPLEKYLSMCEFLNPMHRLWSDGRWNKMILAHGCYWKKCTFCDVSLDYIDRYEVQSASQIVDQIERIISETNQTGFHFVDEAAPPKLLKSMAEELIKRKIQISWWGNIRFEKAFTPELTALLARSGCIAITGGLEVASDRLLKLMEKGVTVEQVAHVTRAFTDAGIMVHAYLMYGFPTQSIQETVDSLEMVRQLFEAGCLQSAYWHRFACTIHSPVGKNPAKYGIILHQVPSTFAKNDIAFTDMVDTDHDDLGVALKKAVYNFMYGIGFDQDVRSWFEGKVPKTKVRRDFIRRALAIDQPLSQAPRDTASVSYLH